MRLPRAVFILLNAGIYLSCCTTTKSTVATSAAVLFDSINYLTPKQVQDGWQLLFDGKSFKGWHKYGGGEVGTAWQIIDGTICLAGTEKNDWQIKDGGDIVADESFENFHLKLEWKISAGGNSGILFLVQEDKRKYQHPYETGPEMQVLDNEKHGDGKILKHRAGDLYDLISCSKESVKPVGEWNKAEIKVQNGKVEFFLNEVSVVNTTLWDEHWLQMIQNSKWKNYPDFAKNRNGFISLQDHGNKVWYRNIMIKRL